MDYTEKARERAKALLISGEVTCVVGWTAGLDEEARSVYCAQSVEACDALVCDGRCEQLAAKLAHEHKGEGKVALLARGCESRAVNRMIADNQLERDQVYILGIPCEGCSTEDGVLLKKCTECQHRNPVVYDELLGDEVEEPQAYRFADVDAIEAMSRTERRAFFDRAYSSCIHCHACRQACPCCTCRTCFADQERQGWQGKQFDTVQARYYGVTRSFHVGDRCIECGECERVCPQGLPLMALMHKQIHDIDALFGPYEGGGLDTDTLDATRTFRTDDIEEFM